MGRPTIRTHTPDLLCVLMRERHRQPNMFAKVAAPERQSSSSFSTNPSQKTVALLLRICFRDTIRHPNHPSNRCPPEWNEAKERRRRRRSSIWPSSGKTRAAGAITVIVALFPVSLPSPASSKWLFALGVGWVSVLIAPKCHKHGERLKCPRGYYEYYWADFPSTALLYVIWPDFRIEPVKCFP